MRCPVVLVESGKAVPDVLGKGRNRAIPRLQLGHALQCRRREASGQATTTDDIDDTASSGKYNVS